MIDSWNWPVIGRALVLWDLNSSNPDHDCADYGSKGTRWQLSYLRYFGLISG